MGLVSRESFDRNGQESIFNSGQAVRQHCGDDKDKTMKDKLSGEQRMYCSRSKGSK